MAEDFEKQTTVQDKPAASPGSMRGILAKLSAESDGNLDYAWRVFAWFCCGPVGTIIQIVLCLAVPVASIAIGVIYLSDCPIQKYIPIYLIVAGVVGIVKGLNNAINACVIYRRKPNPENAKEKQKPDPIDFLVNVFLFAWFIAGSVWVYSIYSEVDYADPSSGAYCHQTAYIFCFCLITISYALAAVSMLCCCLTFGVLLCVRPREDDSN